MEELEVGTSENSPGMTRGPSPKDGEINGEMQVKLRVTSVDRVIKEWAGGGPDSKLWTK